MHGPHLVRDLHHLRLPVVAEQDHIVAINRIGADLASLECAGGDAGIRQRRSVEILRRLVSSMSVPRGQRSQWCWWSTPGTHRGLPVEEVFDQKPLIVRKLRYMAHADMPLQRVVEFRCRHRRGLLSEIPAMQTPDQSVQKIMGFDAASRPLFPSNRVICYGRTRTYLLNRHEFWICYKLEWIK